MIELPIREDLKGKSPYGAPQLNTPVRLNTNENPYPPSDDLAREIGEEAARLAVTLNRYPDRDAVPVSYTHLRSPRDRTRSRMPSSA